MTLPDIDSLDSYGGSLLDYSPVVDPTTDRPGAGANPAYCSIANATHTVPRCWARLTLNGSATPVLVAHDEVWNNVANAAPTPARTSSGLYTLTYPATVFDEITSGTPGFQAGGHTVNLRWCLANDRGGGTWYAAKAFPSAANVITIRFWVFTGGAPANQDPGSAVDIDVVGF